MKWYSFSHFFVLHLVQNQFASGLLFPIFFYFKVDDYYKQKVIDVYVKGSFKHITRPV